MAYLDDLTAARDRYAAELAAQTALDPKFRNNDYERHLLDMLKDLDARIAEAQAAADAAEQAQDVEIVSGGYT